MDSRIHKLDAPLTRLDAQLATLAPAMAGATRAAVERWRADAAALQFHLRRRPSDKRSTLLAVIGGTGTGKSTLVNRLLDADVSAASFRRTFTSGAVAIASDAREVPEGWLGMEHVRVEASALPVSGRAGVLLIVQVPAAGLAGGQSSSATVLIDTPDLDGDQPAHHAQADRAFRWTDAVLFLVTPEKYQMTELLPYYRLARRYGVPAAYVMNKCEEQAVFEDYQRLISSMSPAATNEDVQSSTFVIARDDAGYEPPREHGLEALRSAMTALERSVDPPAREEGLRNRGVDLLGRFNDQVLSPLRDDRRDADALIAALRAMEAPVPGVDVNPITQQLRRRMQERSVLYLIGPQRMLDRVRQAPGLLMRLPRLAWDYVARGELPAGGAGAPADATREVPDFQAVLADQFAVLQSRIDDALRAMPAGERWLADERAASGYAAARLDPAAAARIADEELADLKNWLEKRWNATPRDTKAIETLLRHLPGGKKMSRWSEAAPYLLTVVLVTHHAFFGHIDLLVLGGYGLATWLTEKISNEVASRTRATNTRISERYARLAHEQIVRTCDWLDRLAPSRSQLATIESTANDAARAIGL